MKITEKTQKQLQTYLDKMYGENKNHPGSCLCIRCNRERKITQLIQGETAQVMRETAKDCIKLLFVQPIPGAQGKGREEAKQRLEATKRAIEAKYKIKGEAI
jgi:hypothetical protein